MATDKTDLRPVTKLSSIRIQRFKRITDDPIDLQGVKLLVDGDNSDKSSIIEGLHFAVSLLQRIALSGDWDKLLNKPQPHPTYRERYVNRILRKAAVA